MVLFGHTFGSHPGKQGFLKDNQMKSINNISLTRICALVAVMLSQILPIGVALSSVTDEWNEGLGQAPNSVHSFLFEVTFMNIDVAIVEFQLDAQTATLVTAITAEGDANDSRMDRVGDTLLAAETIAFSMDIQRDTSTGKLLKGMLLNLERAWKAELISESEHELVSERLRAIFTLHDERGIQEGDKLMYRVQPDGVRVILLGVDGEILEDSYETGLAWTKGIKGIFVGPNSKLREKLVEAVWDVE